MNPHLRLQPNQQSTLEDLTRRRQVQSLYAALVTSLVSHAARRLKDDDAEEEVVSDAFAALLEGRFPMPTVDAPRKMRAIVDTLCAQHRREGDDDRHTEQTLRDDEDEG